MGRTTYRNVITSDELKEQFNKENKKLIDRFIKDKTTRCSDTTITGYMSDLNIFFTWNLLHNDNKFFVDIKKVEFADFFSYCVEELKWGSARFGRMKSLLSSFSIIIEKYFDEEYPKFRNIILKVVESMPKNPVREKTVLSEEQVDKLFDYLSNELNNKQEACLLALLVSSGVRIAEVLRITTDIIDENNTAFEGMFLETVKPIKTKGRSRIGKIQTKYLIKDILLPHYNAWIIEREKILKANGLEHNSIFIKRNGQPATEDSLRFWMEKWEKFLEVPIYAHCFRHFIVSSLTRLQLTSDFIIEIMGWSSGGEMYKIYNDVTAKDRKWKDVDKLKSYFENGKTIIHTEEL